MPKNITIIILDITKGAGTERAVTNLANILTESEEYNVSILSVNSFNGNPYYKLNEKINILHGKCGSSIKFIRIIEGVFSVKRNCKNEDIVIGTLSANNISLLFLRKNCIKIAAEHFSYYGHNFFARIRTHLFYPFLDAVVVLTSKDKKNYSWIKNVVVIPNSLSFIPQKLAELYSKRILLIGRYTYQKNFEVIIEAMSFIKDKCNGWQVRIIGDGKDKEKLQKMILEKKMEEIIFLIPPTEKIEDEYYNASIFVMCSRFEGFPMVLVEAKSCGLPIVSFDCPTGPSDIIRDNIDGFLVELGYTHGLSEAILKFVESQDLRRHFGDAAQDDIERFSPISVGKMWFCLLEELWERKQNKNEFY